MVDNLVEEYRDDVALVAELLEDAARGAAACELEIDGVAEIDERAKRIDSDEHPLGHRLPRVRLSQMTREEHEQGVKDVSVKQGGRVKEQAAFGDVRQGSPGYALREDGPVLEEIGEAADEADRVGEQHVANERQCGRFETESHFLCSYQICLPTELTVRTTRPNMRVLIRGCRHQRTKIRYNNLLWGDKQHH